MDSTERMIALHYATRATPPLTATRVTVKKKKSKATQKKKHGNIKERRWENNHEARGSGFADAFAEPPASKRASAKKID